MLKRGQVISQVFAYLLTIVIIGVILIMGYKYISANKEVISKGEFLQFQNKLVSDIKLVGKEHGTLKKISYTLPKNLEELCFVDLSKKDKALSSKLISFYPLIKDSLNSDLNKNIFFVGATELHSLYAGNIQLNHYPYMSCFRSKNNEVEIWIEVLGGGNSLILADFVAKVNINKNQRTVLHSADNVVTIEVPEGTQVSSDYLSIEIIEQKEENYDAGASDLYEFGPAGTAFSPSADLRIRYNPSIVGDCPARLYFYQSNEGTGEELSTPSKYIDCKSKVAIFNIDKLI